MPQNNGWAEEDDGTGKDKRSTVQYPIIPLEYNTDPTAFDIANKLIFGNDF